MNKNDSSKKKNRLKNICIILSACFLFGLILTGIAGYIIYNKFAVGLPKVEYLREYKPSLITLIYSDDEDLVAKYYVENRILVPIERMPAILKQATIAVEDGKFFSHFGIDPEGIIRAFWTNTMKGRIVEGGSTITQQLAKTLFLSPKKAMERKIKEAILAVKIERKFSKNDILEFYLNQIYYGHGAYGVEAAVNTYFNKHVEDINLEEAAMIAGLPRAPNTYSPYGFKKRAKKRRAHVLKRMVTMGFITEKEAKKARAAEFILGGREKEKSKAPYFTEYVRRYLEKKYGSSELYRGGLRVETTLNIKHQMAADKALKEGLRTADKRYGYRGPITHFVLSSSSRIDWEAVKKIESSLLGKNQQDDFFNTGRVRVGVVIETSKNDVTVALGEDEKGVIARKDMRWARKPNPAVDGKYYRLKRADRILRVGDVILVGMLGIEKDSQEIRLALEQEPEVQGSLIAIDPRTGFIRAMSGGYDFYKSQFNRAIQAVRQPGSAFKPIIYSAALQKGFTPASIIIDSPIIYQDEIFTDDRWKPVNFEEKFYGPTTLRTALTHSRNIVTIKLLQKIGVNYVVERARQLGIRRSLNADLSLALGSSGVTLLELTSAYGIYANRGVRVTPMSIKMIKDRDGNIIEDNLPESENVIDEGIAYIIANMLTDVVRHGTGRAVKGLGRPVAGKTGTTNNFFDAWFVGFVPELATGVWVGMDKEQPLGKNETGSRTAAPVWLNFMSEALEGTPVENFSIPPNIVFKKIEPERGLLAGFGHKDAYFECFIEGTEPTEYVKKAEATPKDFFMMDLE